jgi:bacteriocin biosynthesis cyclodehydratase domain-containing protein
MRPTLLPNLRRLWRDERTVQLGTDPASAIILELHRPELARVLDLLDGSHTEQALLTTADALGLDEEDVLDLVRALQAVGLVVGAHALLPSGLPATVHSRLSVEAAAIALRLRNEPTGSRTSWRGGGAGDGRRREPDDALEATDGGHGNDAGEDRAAGEGSGGQGGDPGGEPGSSGAGGGQGTGHGTGPGGERTSGAGRGQSRLGSGPGGARRSPADVLRRRCAARVIVAGDGPLVAPLAAVLASSGVGHVDPVVDGVTGVADVLVGGLSSDDVRSSRAIATATAIVRFAPGADVSSVRADNVDFVVRVGDRQPPALARRGVRLNSLPRLEVTVRLGTVLVGPLVRPSGSPCRRCLDLHRRDRDPAWPVLAAQLATAPPGDGEPCALTTALAGAAFAADEVLAFLDGAAGRTEAAIVEIPRAGEFRRREWAAHPRCDCRRRRRNAPTG